MRILITGATGFVGRAVARRLVANGEDVVAYVRNEARTALLEELGVTIVVGSIGDPNAIAEACEECDAVVHCAAVSDHRAAPRALEWVNVAGTENLINGAAHAGTGRLVHLSCADVTLLNRDRVNFNETIDIMRRPLGAHARSKDLAEEIALSGSSVDIDVIALRPALIWGPDDDSQLPEFCREGLEGGIRLVGRGDNLVAITYIDNLVDAVCAALVSETGIGNVYYVADNEFLSMREFLGTLSETLGLSAPKAGWSFNVAYAAALMRERAGRAGMTPIEVIKRGRATTFDISRGQNDLGWEPKVGLADGMAALRSWASQIGGAEHIAGLRRAPIGADSVDDLVTAAGGD